MIELKLGSASGTTAAKFNTVKTMGNEITVIPTRQLKFSFSGGSDFASVPVVSSESNPNVVIPHNDITFKLNNRKTIGDIGVASLNADTVTIPQDFNLIPARIPDSDTYVTNSGTVFTINLHPDIHVYRMVTSANFRLQINATNYN